eukprot:CAMPEP_0197524262 /NCGR_PEP_ID=MMETSP1318-20131121/8984_1 /TAXON_ID=552666 /ORGANISM="Partenskyella glossopodia, Strain RCC365" /LENGTH=99 /DNA_ID=CAMNT_0043077177 /DNA_START=185 /DNA_END=480 /DNA_ORIENTATION=-
MSPSTSARLSHAEAEAEPEPEPEPEACGISLFFRTPLPPRESSFDARKELGDDFRSDGALFLPTASSISILFFLEVVFLRSSIDTEPSGSALGSGAALG